MSHTYYVAGIPYSDELFHHGVKGQKWGIRRSRQELGYEDYGGRLNKVQRSLLKRYNKDMKKGTRLQARAETIKNRGGDPSKKVDKAKAFLSSAKMAKAMSATYNSLAERERKSINRKYTKFLKMHGFRNMFIGSKIIGGSTGAAIGYGVGVARSGKRRANADNYLTSELMVRRKRH